MGRGQQYSNQPSYGQPQQRYGNNTGYGQPPQRYGSNQGQQRGQPVGRGNGLPYSNAIKQNMNLCYCFSCGYDVDHQGFQCPDPRVNHIPTVKRKDTHTIWGASMKAQHKTLPDGTGAGMWAGYWRKTSEKQILSWTNDKKIISNGDASRAPPDRSGRFSVQWTN
jgi:hypothetical protein